MSPKKSAIDKDAAREMRKRGCTWREIGERFGVSRQCAQQTVTEVHKRNYEKAESRFAPLNGKRRWVRVPPIRVRALLKWGFRMADVGRMVGVHPSSIRYSLIRDVSVTSEEQAVIDEVSAKIKRLRDEIDQAILDGLARLGEEE